MSPEEDRTRDAVDSEPKHYQLSYSGPHSIGHPLYLSPVRLCLYPFKTNHPQVQEDHHTPRGLQRPDRRCGDVEVLPPWFRALCDPDGDTPCCYGNTCVNRTEDQCKCTNCLDLRAPVQAEYATWRPEDERCELRALSAGEMCALLGKSTLYFIGDSLVRHVYTAFLLAVSGNGETGAFREDIPAGWPVSVSVLFCLYVSVSPPPSSPSPTPLSSPRYTSLLLGR